jgi:hypothetical protein
MARLPKSIIKKYGISKKAWAVYRGKKSSKPKSKGGRRMAKRKRSRRGSSGNTLMLQAGAAAVYGAFRPRVEQFIQPVTSRIPVAGNYVDEVTLGAIGYALAKGKVPYLKGKTARAAGKAMLIIEAARVGSGLSQQIM